ncbi:MULTISPECIES: hypothetical protein [Acetobacter]|uniref:hypothetical protein n=1 Tax=Acetobacter TaxID=434 RepID=UPI000A36BB33|nr:MULTISPECIES: hypothetical protein [Acetobacter]MBS1004353.1 hypothetical protein [Acetobacter thailandicus]OUJ11902.1 hypothetical protein HK25_07415 [Acetobacter sp. DsW_059]
MVALDTSSAQGSALSQPSSGNTENLSDSKLEAVFTELLNELTGSDGAKNNPHIKTITVMQNSKPSENSETSALHTTSDIRVITVVNHRPESTVSTSDTLPETRLITVVNHL